MERLQDLIQRVALGRTDARRFMRNARPVEPKKRGAAPRVQFDSETCETATLVEITAEDQPGLLYSLATVFSSHACNIDVVLVDTKGQRAIDVFYVAYEGKKLSTELQGILRDQLLAAC
jgi:[protein-PII] uridylyltransferase